MKKPGCTSRATWGRRHWQRVHTIRPGGTTVRLQGSKLPLTSCRRCGRVASGWADQPKTSATRWSRRAKTPRRRRAKSTIGSPLAYPSVRAWGWAVVFVVVGAAALAGAGHPLKKPLVANERLFVLCAGLHSIAALLSWVPKATSPVKARKSPHSNGLRDAAGGEKPAHRATSASSAGRAPRPPGGAACGGGRRTETPAAAAAAGLCCAHHFPSARALLGC